MKTFELQELIDWLEANPDRTFNYYNPTTSSIASGGCGCMLYEFFNDKLENNDGIACKISSPWICYSPSTQEPLGVINGSEHLSLVKIHSDLIRCCSASRSSDLLKSIRSELASVTPS